MDKDNLITYYVDESGDFTLFNKKGYPVQSKGSSKTIMLGLLKVRENPDFDKNFKLFKEMILSDLIFQTFPSIKKTQLLLHASNDHVAIRREVFKYISDLDFSVQVVIRRKSALIEQAKTQLEYTKNKITDKQLYGDLVTSLFKHNIHKANQYDIYFSDRGKTFSNKSLISALHSTKEKFILDKGITSNSNFSVFCSKSSEQSGLQIIDYCLWALQRMYERKEDVYFSLVKDKFKLIIDIDDKRTNNAGAHYTQKNMISLSKIDGVS